MTPVYYARLLFSDLAKVNLHWTSLHHFTIDETRQIGAWLELTIVILVVMDDRANDVFAGQPRI